jgi:hypothetical protein
MEVPPCLPPPVVRIAIKFSTGNLYTTSPYFTLFSGHCCTSVGRHAQHCLMVGTEKPSLFEHQPSTVHGAYMALHTADVSGGPGMSYTSARETLTTNMNSEVCTFRGHTHNARTISTGTHQCSHKAPVRKSASCEDTVLRQGTAI